MARGNPLPVFLWFISMGLNHTWGDLLTYDNLQLDITGIYNIYYIYMYIIERAIAANLQAANYSYIPPKTLDSTNLAHFSGKIMFFLAQGRLASTLLRLGCRTKHPQTWVQTEPPKLVENTG
jgi:hypothetical protein